MMGSTISDFKKGFFMENSIEKTQNDRCGNAEGFAFRRNGSSEKKQHITAVCDASQAELVERLWKGLGPGVPFDWAGNSPWLDRAMPDLPLAAGSPEQLRLMNWAVGDYDQAAVLFLYGAPPETAGSLSDYLGRIRAMAPGARFYWASRGGAGKELLSALPRAGVTPVDLTGRDTETAAGILAERAQAVLQSAQPPRRYDASVREDAEWTNLSFDRAENLPRILLIGDSICNGYAPYVRDSFRGRFAVDFFQTSEGTRHPNLARAIGFLLGRRKYRLIHFNNGIHLHGAGIAEYGENLGRLFSLFRERGEKAELVFATTTPVHKREDPSVADGERTGLFRRYNQTAVSLCTRLGIPVDDLFRTAWEGNLRKVDEFHFAEDGYRKLAQAVTACIESRISAAG